MFCPACRTVNHDDARWCYACGASLAAGTATPAAVTAAPLLAIPAGAGRRHRGRTWRRLSLFILALALGVGAVLLATQLRNNSLGSKSASAETARAYLRNQQRILDALTRGVADGEFKQGSVLALSAQSGERHDDVDAWYLDGVETAPGFRVALASSSRKIGAGTMRSVSGNILLVFKQATVALPSRAVAPTQSDIRLLGAHYSANVAETVFPTAEPPGGELVIRGDVVTLRDRGGVTVATYTFDGASDVNGMGIEANVRDVQDSAVPPPDRETVDSACHSGAVAVANFKTFLASYDTARTGSTGSTELHSFHVSKVARYDCKSGEKSLKLHVEFSGQSSKGKFVQAFVVVSPAAVAVPSATTSPAVTAAPSPPPAPRAAAPPPPPPAPPFATPAPTRVATAPPAARPAPETWSGAATATLQNPTNACGGGAQVTLSYSLVLQVPGSLLAALRGEQEITLGSDPSWRDTNGTIRGTATVVRQPENAGVVKCTLLGGISPETAIVFYAIGGSPPYIHIDAPPPGSLRPWGSYEISNSGFVHHYDDLARFPVYLDVTVLGTDQVSGALRAGFGSVGTFTLTKR